MIDAKGAVMKIKAWIFGCILIIKLISLLILFCLLMWACLYSFFSILLPFALSSFKNFLFIIVISIATILIIKGCKWVEDFLNKD